MKDRRCVLFAGNASQQLAEKIARQSNLAINLGNIYHHQFPSGEWYCQFKENIRGDDVFLLQAISDPANDNLMQLLVMADAARRASADRITAVIPYFGYQRQDRKDKPRVPISAKLIMNLLVAAGIQRVITMDLHAQQIQGFTDLPVDHLYFQPSLARALKDLNIQVVVAPDIGAVKKASEYAEREKLDIAFIIKKRKNDTDVEVTQFVGDVKDKNVLVLDDLTESAGTLISAANCCKNNGAKLVCCAVTHPCLTATGHDRLAEAFIAKTVDCLYVSNTVSYRSCGCYWNYDQMVDNPLFHIGAPNQKARVPVAWNFDKYVNEVDVSDVFGKAIHGTHFNKSITSLFQ